MGRWEVALAGGGAAWNTFEYSPAFWEVVVGLHELEAAVTDLPAEDLAAFARWFEDYLADAWDRQIGADIQEGRLDEIGRQADADFEAGRCKPL
jgi:hypothetical protein